jgi:hypothetical protein
MILAFEIVLSPDLITNSIFVVCAVVIGYFLTSDRKGLKDRLEKNEDWLMTQQREINELNKNTHSAIELLKKNQEHDGKRLDLFEKLFFENKKISQEILDKIRAITPK